MERPRTVTLGDIEITPVWDGTLDANMDGIRGLDPAAASRLIAAEQQATGVDPLVLPVRAFLVRSGGHLTLIDSGSGDTKGPRMGHLPASLAALGVAPADIGAIVMTHLHLDHSGGLVDASGAALFPNAQLVLHEAEAAYFLDTPTAALDARSQRHAELQRALVAPYRERLRRVRDGEGTGGLTALLAPGHTPGHTAWLAASGGRRLMVLGDVVHLGAVQLPRPDTAMIYDVHPIMAAATRHRILELAAHQRMLVAGAHLAAPGLGTIVRTGTGYRFEPTVISAGA